MKQTKDNHWVLIPPTVLADKSLPAGTKILYGRVLGLTEQRGYCWASNEFLGECIGLSKNTVKKYLGVLYKRGFLSYEIKRNSKTKEVNERRIYPALVDHDTRGRRTPRGSEDPTSIKEEIDKREKGLQLLRDKIGELKKDKKEDI